MSDSPKHKPAVISGKCEGYEEPSSVICLYTSDGLRTRVYYRVLKFEPTFELWIEGDKRYGLAGFAIYMTMELRGTVPNIERVGSPMAELTRV
jgi:hypothetical protein